jgi:hypothetical protein
MWSHEIRYFNGQNVRRDTRIMYFSRTIFIESMITRIQIRIKNMKVYESSTKPEVKIMQGKEEETKLTNVDQDE